MKRFLIYLLFATPILAHAQINLQKGYIVKSVGDTVRGFIDYRERNENPRAVKFSISPSDKTILFTPKNCLGFGIDGMESYQRHLVNISQSQEMLSYLSKGVDTTYTRDTVFLKVLNDGPKITLYKYSDQIKARYYVKEQGSLEPQELIKRVFLNPESNNIVTVDRYRLQLINLYRVHNGNVAAEQNRINNVRYSESELVLVAEKINQQTHVKSNISKIRYLFGAGLNMNMVSYTGQHRLASGGAITTNSFLPSFSAGIDYLANPFIGKMVYRLEVNYAFVKGDNYSPQTASTGYGIRHQFDQHSLSLIPQVLYHFYNKGNVKTFISAGAGFNFPTYKNNIVEFSYTSSNQMPSIGDEVQFQSFYYSFQAKAGVVLGKRFELTAAYVFKTSLTNYIYYNVNLQRISLGLNYLLGGTNSKR